MALLVPVRQSGFVFLEKAVAYSGVLHFQEWRDLKLYICYLCFPLL